MLNHLEMVGFIRTNGTQCRFVSLTCSTVPKLKKTCPFVGVRKISRKIGLLNANYNTSVRRKISEKLGVELAEVDYKNGETWYKHELTSDGKNLPLVVHKEKQDGKFYLQYFPHKSVNKYVGADGVEIAESALEPYFYAKGERPDFKPCVIAIGMENIVELRASGIVIEMPEFSEAEAILAD
jgi:hypothetical protein